LLDTLLSDASDKLCESIKLLKIKSTNIFEELFLDLLSTLFIGDDKILGDIATLPDKSETLLET
jgi:hypothetical protein